MATKKKSRKKTSVSYALVPHKKSSAKSRAKRVKFKIKQSVANPAQYFGELQTGSEITYVSETYAAKSSVIKTMRSTIKKIQAGEFDIEAIDKAGNITFYEL